MATRRVRKRNYGETVARAAQLISIELDFVEGDFTAGATSEAILLGTCPAGFMPLGVDIDVGTAFTGGGTTDAKVAVGDAGDDDVLLASADVDVATAGKASTYTLGIAPHKYYAAATALNLKMTSAGANVSAFTAGAGTARVVGIVLGG